MGPPPAGVREPRRPLPFAGAGAVALPQPDDQYGGMKQRLPTRDTLTRYWIAYVLVALVIALVVLLALPSGCNSCNFSPTNPARVTAH